MLHIRLVEDVENVLICLCEFSGDFCACGIRFLSEVWVCDMDYRYWFRVALAGVEVQYCIAFLLECVL